MGYWPVVVHDLLELAQDLAARNDVERACGRAQRFVELLVRVMRLVPRHAGAVGQRQHHEVKAGRPGPGMVNTSLRGSVMPDIASWLARLGLDKYIEAFTANEVDFDALRHLKEDDLRELGLPVGPRRKVLAAIAALDDDTMSQTSSGSAPASAALRREAERRQLTVMFIDLVGSTELSQRLDPEEMRDVIGVYQSAVSAEIARYEGYVAKLMGDGVLAYFGWPQRARRRCGTGGARWPGGSDGDRQPDDAIGANPLRPASASPQVWSWSAT